MEPEIARRCLDCGASVRGNASFCPQCGKPLKTGAASVSSAADSHDIPARRMTDAGRSAPTIDSSTSAPAPPASDLAATRESFGHDALGESHQSAEVAATRTMEESDGASSKRQWMASAARDVVDEKLSPRVEKLRQASNVMLEEASYDPSLRFVLVAVAILVLSLFLLLLNYLLG